MITASKIQKINQEETELTIDKALEFAGDNSHYQKRRLTLISFIILSFALLNWTMIFMPK